MERPAKGQSVQSLTRALGLPTILGRAAAAVTLEIGGRPPA